MMPDTTTPTETYGRRLYIAVLVFVSLLSVAGNAVYAHAAPATVDASLPPGWAAGAHMIPPVLLLLVTEVLAMASTKFSGKGRAWALAGVVVIAAAAFILSFDALYEVARMAKVRSELAWLVPVMLDVSIIVCTVLVLMASRQMQRDRVAAELPAHPALHTLPEPVLHTPDEVAHPVLHTLPEPVLEVEERVRPEERTPDDLRADAPGEQALAEHPEAAHPVPHTPAAPVREAEEVVCTEPVMPTAEPPAHPVPHTPPTELHSLTERVYTACAPEVSADVISAVLVMRDEGASQRAMARHADVSPHTVKRWLVAAERITAEGLAIV